MASLPQFIQVCNKRIQFVEKIEWTRKGKQMKFIYKGLILDRKTMEETLHDLHVPDAKGTLDECIRFLKENPDGLFCVNNHEIKIHN